MHSQQYIKQHKKKYDKQFYIIAVYNIAQIA